MVHPKADGKARADFNVKLHRYETIERRAIIYIDESGFALEAPRENGYRYRGAKCYGNSRGRVNAIGAIHKFK